MAIATRHIEACRQKPDSAKCWHELASILDEIDRQELDLKAALDQYQARTCWKKALSLDPKYLPAWEGLARHYQECELPRQYKDSLEHILKLDPKRMPALVELGLLLCESLVTNPLSLKPRPKKKATPKDLQRATALLQQAIAVDDEQSRVRGAFVYLSSLYLVDGKKAGAKRLLQQHLSLNPRRSDDISAKEVKTLLVALH